ncbi:hypothetical protein SAMN02927924_01356 [Sphingobium faniae]|nr:hypothetical protein SAMN02927924_01356 [Sphingobium faniae]
MNFVTVTRMHNPKLAAWTLLRFAQAPLSIADIVCSDGPTLPLGDILELLNRWRGAGLIERIDKPESYIMHQKAKAFRNPPTVGAVPREPKPRSTRQRIWSAIRVMRSFDLVELCMAASVDRRPARNFLNQLTRAGYLVRTDRGDGEQPHWRLGRPSGSKHPSVEYDRRRTVVALIDRNSGERFPLSPTQKFLAAEIHHVS